MADYSLTAGDIATLQILIRIQSDIIPSVTPLTQAGVWDFMVQLDALAKEHYTSIHNTQLKAWVDGIYTPLSTTPTVYKCSVTALYIAACWGRWMATSGWPTNYRYPFPDMFWKFAVEKGSHWPWPDTPGYWHDAVRSLISGWEPPNAPPQNIFWEGPSTTFGQQISLQRALFDPSHWTDVGTVSTIIGKVTEAQSAAVHALVSAGALSPDSALFLVWLLLVIVTYSSTADQRLAAKILSASAPSPEYPNDILANQLIYLMLMTLADPLGICGWPNATLQSTLQSLIAVIHRDDPASVALRQSLTNHLKVLIADSAYPMQDPYSPNIGFTTRQTDTLAALNRAWATLPHQGGR
jgi:hypothetical protein